MPAECPSDADNNQSGDGIVSRARPSRFVPRYSPSKITFAENFLYQGSLLNLIKNPGKKYRRGEL